MYDLQPCYDSLAHGRKMLIVRGALSDVLDAAEAKRMAGGLERHHAGRYRPCRPCAYPDRAGGADSGDRIP
ncbi:MAG: hypothetical protein WDN06_06175 [Asticcacaulis sp.]